TEDEVPEKERALLRDWLLKDPSGASIPADYARAYKDYIEAYRKAAREKTVQRGQPNAFREYSEYLLQRHAAGQQPQPQEPKHTQEATDLLKEALKQAQSPTPNSNDPDAVKRRAELFRLLMEHAQKSAPDANENDKQSADTYRRAL